MTRSEQINTYVTPDTESELKQRARDEDMSLSAYVSLLIDRGLTREAEDDIASEVRARENLERLISQGTDDLAAVARQIADAESQWAAYSIVNFLILKNQHDINEQTLNDLFAGAQERLDSAEPDAAGADE